MVNAPAQTIPVADREYDLNDAGTAQRFVDAKGADWRYVARWNRFIVWDGLRWEVNENGAVTRLFLDMLQEGKVAASQMADRKRAEVLWNFLHQCGDARRIDRAISLARQLPGMTILPDALDARPDLFVVRNGTLDLQSMTLRESRRGDFMTRMAGAPFDPTARAPAWAQFLSQTFDDNDNLIGFVRRGGGYSLFGGNPERVMFVNYGCGANGKSTLVGALQHVFGDYATCAPAGMLLAKRNDGIPNDVARLKGARFVPAMETGEGRRFDESLVKQMTGGEDMLTARFMKGEWFDFRPDFKLWLSTNHRPVIRGTDPAIWDRIRLIPFGTVIPEAARDKSLPQRLRDERAGILAWLCCGFEEWQATGLGTPAEVKAATADYRNDMDVIGEFIEACCEPVESCTTFAMDLYAAYRKWCGGEHPMSQKKFGTGLGDKGFTKERGPGNRYVWKGLKLIEVQTPERAQPIGSK